MERYGRGFIQGKPGEPWRSASSPHRRVGGLDPLPSCGLLSGFSWPPRSYTCSFCKREFRSAQALGGHMNVHRRDRARLRQSPPWDTPPRPDLNLSPGHSPPNPNPNPYNPIPNLNIAPTSCFTSAKPPPEDYTYTTQPSLLSPPSPVCSIPVFSSRGDGSWNKSTVKGCFGIGGVEGFPVGMTGDVSRKMGGVVALDLMVGMYGDLQEDLDLELRLGYA